LIGCLAESDSVLQVNFIKGRKVVAKSGANVTKKALKTKFTSYGKKVGGALIIYSTEKKVFEKGAEVQEFNKVYTFHKGTDQSQRKDCGSVGGRMLRANRL